MGRSLKCILAGILILAMLTVLCSCGNSNKEDNIIRIGYFPNITHAQALIGKDGIYEDALSEYQLQWSKFNAGSSEIEALMAGEIDLGYIGPGPAINGYIKSNGDLTILAGASEAGAALVCRQDLDIQNFKDLAGHRIAIPQLGNTQHVVLEEMLKENGLKDGADSESVEVVAVQNADLMTLFDQGSIDAAFVPEPWASNLIQDANAKLVLEYNETWRNGEYPVAVVIGRTEFVEAHPEVVQKFLETHAQITDKINSDREYALTEINKGLEKAVGQPLEISVLESSLDRMKYSTDVNKQAVLDMKNFMYELGLIHEDEDIEGIFMK